MDLDCAACGHVYDEHRLDAKGGIHECEVEGCDCCMFEEGDDAPGVEPRDA